MGEGARGHGVYYDSKEAVVCEKIDKGFPVELLEGDTDWTNYMKIPRRHIQGSKICR